MIPGNANRDPSVLSVQCQLQGVFINSQLFWMLLSGWMTSGQPNTNVSASHWRIYAILQHAMSNAVFWLHFRTVALKPASNKLKNTKWTMSLRKQVTIIMTIVICHPETSGTVSVTRAKWWLLFPTEIQYLMYRRLTWLWSYTRALHKSLWHLLFSEQQISFFPDLLVEQCISLTWLLFMSTQKVRTSSLK